MRRPVLALMSGLLLMALLPGSAMALTAGDLDQQSNLVGHSLASSADQAQTFTAGKTGALDDVELYFNGSGTITVTIQTTSGGLPTGTVLATTTATPGSGTDWVDFAFASPASVTSGVTYAIVFNTGVAAAVWGTANTDPDNYSAGAALRDAGTWVASNSIGDFGFRTYVSVSSEGTPPSEVTAPPTATETPGSSRETVSMMLLLAGLVAICGGALVALALRRNPITRG
jgi:hypothetical protein